MTHRWLALAAALTMAAGTCLVSVPAGVAWAVGDNDEDEASQAAVSVTITSASTGLTDKSQDFTVSGTITNLGSALSGAEVGLRLAAGPFADRAALDQWRSPVLDQIRGDDSWECRAEKVDLAAGATTDFSLKCLVNQMNLGNRPGEPGWGPRGFLVTVATAQAVLTAAPGYLTYSPASAVHTKTRLTVVVPLVRAPGEAWAVSAARLERVMAAADAPDVTWLVDPAVLAEEAIRAGAQPLTAAVSHALETGRLVYVLPYGDPDLARLAHAPRSAAALVEQAQSYGEDWLNQTLGVPTASLARSGVARLNGPVDAATVRLAEALGARALLSGSSGPATGLVRPGQVVELSAGQISLPALVSDSVLAQVLLEPPAQAQTQPPGYAMAVLAYEAVGQQVQGRPGRAAVIMPQDFDPSPAMSQDLAQMLGAAWVQGASLETALETRPADRLGLAESDGPTTGPSNEQLANVIGAAARTQAFATITENPDQLYQQVLGGLLDAVSNSCGTRPTCNQLASEAVTQATDRMDQVSIVTGGEINLISGEGKVPVVVANLSDDAISNLTVELLPQTAALRAGDAQVVTIAPGGQATARIEVSAVANGTVQMQVNMLSPGGQPVAPPAGFTMRVRAGWEDAFTGVVGGLAVVVLVIGLTQSVRRRRAGRPDPSSDTVAPT